ncbi:MAG: hybrid sensor histidine kinase/response regulator [Longimicrobiales bacterium]
MHPILRATLSAAPTPVVVVDLEGLVRGGWNEAAERLFGWTEAEAKNQLLNDLLKACSEIGDPVPLTPDSDGWPTPAGTIKVSTKGGNRVSVCISRKLIHNASGATVGAVIFLEDRSQRASLEAQLKQAQKLEAVGQLTGGIAHDFNNLLTIVQTNAELLGDQLDLGEGTGPEGQVQRTVVGEHLDDIQAAVTRGSDLVRRLMAFGRSDPTHSELVNLGTLISTYGDTLRRVLSDSIQIEVVVGPQVPTVRADPGVIQQIILNLATNARDAMPAGGLLRLQATRASPPGDRTSATENKNQEDWAQLTVADSGEGVEAHIVPHIFEPFFTTKSADQGTGLGLSMVQELTRQLGGSVSVDSTPGEGTEFRILIPPGSPDVKVTPSPAEPGIELRDRNGTGTVLIVEDDASVRKVIRRTLSGAGYHVVVTADGEQAVEAFRAHQGGVDLVVSDLVMPNMDGATLYEELAGEGGSSVPFLFISGYGDQDTRVEALIARGVPVLHKPWSVQQLCEAVQDALGEGT